MTALKNRGDIVRRLVARTIPQQLESLEIVIAPFQHALSTRAGSECVAHVYQTLIDVDPVPSSCQLTGELLLSFPGGDAPRFLDS